ncbi:TPA: hypothetical protein RG501_RS13045 [Providencia rettgeri]|nr:hypothetical protein [Providencia rettgeri]
MQKPILVAIGKQLALIKKEKKISGKEFNITIEIPEDKLLDYDDIVNNLDAYTLTKILELFDITVGEFFLRVSQSLKETDTESYERYHSILESKKKPKSK